METAKNMVADKGREIVSVPVGTTLFTTLEKMNQKKVGAILVTRDKKIVGIWTERDLILEGGPTGSFDGWGIMAPTVVFEKDHVVLFYTAWEYEDRSDLPESALRRFGMGRKNGDAIHGTLGRAVARLKPEGP